jgi:hypothetical protein
MEYLAFVLLLPFVLASVYVLASGIRPSKSGSPRLPPGPKPFPVIGNILEIIGDQPHRVLSKLSKTYGPLMTLKLGSKRTIVISSPDLAKEVLQKHDQIFSGRPIPDAVRALDHDKFSIGWLPATAHWRNLRKVSATQVFSQQKLNSTQAIRRKKVQELVDHVKENCSSGQAVDIGRAAFITSLNAISNTLFSKDLADYSSTASQEFLEIILGTTEEAGRPNVADYFPALRFVDPQGVRRRLTINFRNCFRTLDGIINERLQLRGSSKGSKASNDVLDSLLDLTQEDNSELSWDDIRHLLLVIDYFLELFLSFQLYFDKQLINLVKHALLFTRLCLLRGLIQQQAQWNGQWQSYYIALKKWQKPRKSLKKWLERTNLFKIRISQSCLIYEQ